MQQQELIPHLFRTEAGKITTVLCKLYGMDQVELAEDITADTFLSAMETWPYKGIPPNPAAWLYTVAKHKAINFFTRKKIFDEKITRELQLPDIISENDDPDFSAENIADSQLRMLFAVCDPVIADESQIALALRILCGFGIEEIANAFLCTKEVIYKRIFRAKERLRNVKFQAEYPDPVQIETRSENVLRTIYLLFSEGYYSETNENTLREDLCFEAMRLVNLLLENEKTNNPSANALMALMCFHASRFAARRDSQGRMIFYDDQDESLWNRDLIAKGSYFFQLSSKGNEISRYHLEAGIAYWHTIRNDTKDKWENILQLYNKLLVLEYSPMAALNRTYALSKARSVGEAISAAEKLQLNDSQYYFTLLGVLYKNNDAEKSRNYLNRALELAKTPADRDALNRQLRG